MNPLLLLFLLIVSRREWKGSWSVIGSELAAGTFRALYIGYNREWEGIRPPILGGELQKIP